MLNGLLLGLLVLRSLGAKTTKTGLQFHGVFSVTQDIPGRLRMYCPLLKNNQRDARILEEQLLKVPGISGIAINCITGSILITYAQNQLDKDLLVGAVIRLLQLEQKILVNQAPKLMKEMKQAKTALNHVMMAKTHGLLNLDFLLLLIVLGAAGRDIYQLRKIDFPGAATLLYWAYNLLNE